MEIPLESASTLRFRGLYDPQREEGKGGYLMPDITMCQDKECPMKNKCYRYTAVPSMRQSYFAESPREGNECKYKWSLTHDEA